MKSDTVLQDGTKSMTEETFVECAGECGVDEPIQWASAVYSGLVTRPDATMHVGKPHY